MRRKKKNYGAAADGSASANSNLYGRNKGKAGSNATMIAPRGSTLGPITSTAPKLTSPSGKIFRNNMSFGDNRDRIQVIQHAYDFSLKGYHNVLANGSALISGGAVEWVNDIFWTQYYDMLWHMAQRRDGYRATASPPLTSTSVPREMFDLTVITGINLRVINQVYGASMVNEGLRSTMSAFAAINPDLLGRLTARFQAVMYPSWLKPIIEYWGQIYSIFPGGPIVVPFFNYGRIEDELVPASGSYQAWPLIPDLNVAADVSAWLSDIDLALTQLLDGNCADLTDVENFMSLQDMMGHEMPGLTPGSLINDPVRFIDQYQSLGFHCTDSKGAGTDTDTFWPDMRGSEDTLVSVHLNGASMDELWWIGAKGIYAYDADDDDTPGYTAAANNLTAYGMVFRTDPAASENSPLWYATKIYTREDGWRNFHENHDITSASGLQALFWQRPWLTVHPEAWRVVMSEEDEEIYKQHFRVPTVQVPAGEWGREYAEWLVRKSGLPFTV